MTDGPATGWRDAAGDLLLGASCHGCGRPAWTLCAACRADLRALRPGPRTPDPCPDGFPTTWSAGPYDRLARNLVSAHKERSALGLTAVLGEALALAVLGLLDDAGLLDRTHVLDPGVAVRLVPVPSSRRAVRARGFDAGLALARAAARRLPGARAAPLLVPARRVADQSGLGARERHANLAGAYRLRARSSLARPGRVPGSPPGDPPVALVVVDDVVTSGASLTEAVRALEAGGAAVLGAATVAATVRRRPASTRAAPTWAPARGGV